MRHMANAGFPLEDHVSEDLDAIKVASGIPSELSSCHTAFIGGYVVEGHVPAHTVQRLLTEQPTIQGLTAPGMPVGSPGMEMDGVPADRYDVLAIDWDGRTEVFEHFGPGSPSS